MEELQLEDPEAFMNFLRLDMATFHELLARAILDVMEAKVMKTPIEPQDWLQVAEQFQGRLQFPHVLGALDGNYKGFCSIVVMGLVDADYKFLWIQVGDVGSSSDSQIWNHCALHQSIQQGILGIPDAEPLPFDDVDIPYYIIADYAFAIKSWLMKPFSRQGLAHDELVFNYRLSRARCMVENAFWLLANRFRCLLSTLQVKVATASLIVRTCVVLHDVMILDKEDVNHNLVPGARRDTAKLEDMNHTGVTVTQ
ncbi:uncharacterized protein [Haliotis cracherodii]|uniref:uncharacterized protein n=1 Tax=Haliotis cracherodii TaxID=6455 RepID=UPI0039E93D71